jgi:enamine deaminase RidA (YjgF/YER057c/UK114 family)
MAALPENPARAAREDIVPAGLERHYTEHEYSPAVRVGDVVHLAGVIGVRDDGGVDQDASAQFAQAFANLGEVLTAAGCSFADLVEMTTFHVGLREHLPAFVAAKHTVMSGPPYPAWTAVGVAELGIPGALVEIRTTAHVPSGPG